MCVRAHRGILKFLCFVFQTQELTLRYNRQNFYEVYVKNPGSELILTLVHTHPADGEPADKPLWECEIQAGQWL